MSNIDLDYSDVMSIIKNNLKIEDFVKTIKSIFQTTRYFDKIDYKPYFQREYVWDPDKASYFIESIILGTEIPPIVLFDNGESKEVIDGRQRFETVNKFLHDELVLSKEGLNTLYYLAGCRYSDLEIEIRERFESTRLRILQCTVVNEPNLPPEKEDKIKKQIFKRYNTGITSLNKNEIARADYIEDSITQKLLEKLNNDTVFFEKCSQLYLLSKHYKYEKREKTNILANKIRILLALQYIPIVEYSNHNKTKENVIKRFYSKFVAEAPYESLPFEIITNELYQLYTLLDKNKLDLTTKKLVYDVFFWLYCIMYDNKAWINCSNKAMKIYDILIEENKSSATWNNIEEDYHQVDVIFESTGSHYSKSIKNRYQFALNCGEILCQENIKYSFSDKALFTSVMKIATEANEYPQYCINKAKPESLLIDDILNEMKKNKFLIRPAYQRNEVANLQKASYLIESIVLGIPVPPVYVYKKKDGVKEVIDGQQRILTILGFLGEPYLDEKGETVYSNKNRFTLTKLKILKDLNGFNVDTLDSKFIDKIYDFSIDVIELEEDQNLEFDPVDLFLRLNTKPFPIKEDSFEMWNAYIDKDIILFVKKMATEYQDKVFRKKDPRMKLEELIICLAFMDYTLSQPNGNIRNCLNIYVKKNLINARIASKEKITKVLVDISNTQNILFMQSLENVVLFCNKVSLLFEKGYDLSFLFSSERKTRNYKTNQNYYLIWYMLRDVSTEDIKIHHKFIAERINALFSKIQSVGENFNADDFIDSLTTFRTNLF